MSHPNDINLNTFEKMNSMKNMFGNSIIEILKPSIKTHQNESVIKMLEIAKDKPDTYMELLAVAIFHKNFDIIKLMVEKFKITENDSPFMNAISFYNSILPENSELKSNEAKENYNIIQCPFVIMSGIGGDIEIYKYLIKNKLISNKDYYSNSDIYKFLNDIIAGLYYLHANGIIHRDIKPNNILLDKNNVCKITDFNVSTILEDLNVDNIGKKICSADHFRPPEACNISLAKSRKSANDVNVDNKIGGDFRGKPIDIWALGVTAYILAYNKFPFESKNDSVFELYEKIYSAKFEFPEYPTRRENIKKIITRCLEKDPNKRITIEELSKFSFIDKSGRDSIIKWNSNKKIKVIEKEILKSINFLCPPCKAIYQNMKTRIKKEIDISRMTFESFKGKTFTVNEKYCTSIEDKYGVFVVDGFLFRKVDFGMKSYMDEIEEKKKKKKQMKKKTIFMEVIKKIMKIMIKKIQKLKI